VTAASPADWAAFLSLGTAISAGVSIPFFLFVDADLADFDPRPALDQLARSGRIDPVLNAVANAKHDAREVRQRAALTVAALLLLLSAPTVEVNHR
jgi:hypothetical protein